MSFVEEDRRCVTLAEAQAFGERLEKAFAERDSMAYLEMVDWRTMMMSGLAAGGMAEVADEALAMMKVRIASGSRILLERIADGAAHLRMIRSRAENQAASALLRCVRPGRQFTYREFMLTRGDDDRVVAYDVFCYQQGDYTSELSRSMLRLMEPQIQRYTKALEANPHEMPQIEPDPLMIFCRLCRQGDHRGAVAAFENLSDEERDDKTVVRMLLDAAGKVGRKAMEGAAEHVLDRFAGDPCFDFWMLSFYLTTKQKDDALACIDRIDRRIGGDAFLNVVRSRVHEFAGEKDEAWETALAAREAAPELPGTTWQVHCLSLKYLRHGETVSTLQTLRDRFEIEIKRMEQKKRYAHFLQSPEGRAWMNDRAKS